MPDEAKEKGFSQITNLIKKLNNDLSHVINYMTFIGKHYNNEFVQKFIKQTRFRYRSKIFSTFAIYIFYASCNWLSLLTDRSVCLFYIFYTSYKWSNHVTDQYSLTIL